MAAELAVFVSHSSDDNPITQVLVDKLRPALEAAWPGARVMVDYAEIKGGDDWRERIDTMMYRCNAALLLMTPQVLARPEQVLHEANVLSFLFRSNRQYRLWVARAPKVTLDDTKKKDFAAANLPSVQHLKKELTTEGVDALVAEICESLGDLKRARGAPDPVADHLERELQSEPTGNLCRDLAKRLAFEVPASWGSEMGAAVAEATAQEAVYRRQRDIDIRALMSGLHTGSEERRRWLIRHLSPLWVRRGPADRLREHAPEGERKGAGAIAIKGKRVHAFTAQMHVQRAFGIRDDQYRFCRVPLAPGGVTLEGITKSLCAWWKKLDSDYENLKESEIVERLKTDLTRPVFVSLECMPEPDVRAALLRDFPRMLFIAPPPLDGPADEAPIELELESDQEVHAYLTTEATEFDGWIDLGGKTA